MGAMLATNVGLVVLEMRSCRLGPAACLLIADGLKVRHPLFGLGGRVAHA